MVICSSGHSRHVRLSGACVADRRESGIATPSCGVLDHGLARGRAHFDAPCYPSAHHPIQAVSSTRQSVLLLPASSSLASWFPQAHHPIATHTLLSSHYH